MVRKLYFVALFLIATLQTFAQIVVPSNNIITNGDFMSRDPQQRPLFWNTGMGLQTATLSGQEKHGFGKDDQSLKIADTSAISNLLIRTEKHIASPGTTYILSAWAKHKSGTPANLKIEFWDQNNAIIGSETAKPSESADWQQLSVKAKAPDKCTHVTVSISTYVAEKSLSFWDDVSLTREETYNAALIPGVHELFMDDYRIEQLVDVERVVNPAVKSNILIKATEPWEGVSTYIYGTVLKNEPAGTGYRMWYCAYNSGKYLVCYATSKDGINWVKPNLGIVEFNGSKQNNICRIGGGTLVYDPDDEDASRRYKMMSFDGEVKENFGYNVYFSADGLHWAHYGKPVLPYGDVSNVAYDRKRKLFIATTKQRMLVSNTSVTPGKNDRAAFVSVSTDFINWHAPGAPASLYTLAVEGDPLDDRTVMAKGGIEANVYGMTVYPYEGVYIGTPWLFDIMTYNAGEFATTGDGKIQPQVAISRDLKQWSRPVRDALIPLGKAGAWDDGTLYTSSTMQVTEKEMSIYYGAMDLPHGGSNKGMTQHANIARASWRRDGMVSMHNAGNTTGSITTKPVILNGGKLKVNVKLNAGGSFSVQLLDAEGKPIPGYASKTVTGDQLGAAIQWPQSAKLSALQQKEVRLKFTLIDGDIYSYWLE